VTKPLSPIPEPQLPAARERVVEALTQHFANDSLSETELENRLQSVYAVTTTRELDALLADLPALPGTETLPARPDTDIKALFSGQERKLAGPVPHGLRLRARLGYVELDLTQATFEPGVTTIDVGAFMGYVQIRFPHGVRVESAGRALFGYFAIKGAVTNAPSIVRIVGRARFGFVEAYLPGPDPT